MMSLGTISAENTRLSCDIWFCSREAVEIGWNVVNALCQTLCDPLRGPVWLYNTIALDFSQILTDNCGITPVPPLPLVGDVHPGRVFLRPDGTSIRQRGCHG